MRSFQVESYYSSKRRLANGMVANCLVASVMTPLSQSEWFLICLKYLIMSKLLHLITALSTKSIPFETLLYLPLFENRILLLSRL